jgi:hypothetical protein
MKEKKDPKVVHIMLVDLMLGKVFATKYMDI